MRVVKRLRNGGVESVGRGVKLRREGFWSNWREQGSCLGAEGGGRGLGVRSGGSALWEESARTIYRRLVEDLLAIREDGKWQWSRMAARARTTLQR